ncbi:hypothetical protein RYX36_029976 [Vicia faba]
MEKQADLSSFVVAGAREVMGCWCSLLVSRQRGMANGFSAVKCRENRNSVDRTRRCGCSRGRGKLEKLRWRLSAGKKEAVWRSRRKCLCIVHRFFIPSFPLFSDLSIVALLIPVSAKKKITKLILLAG